MPKATKEAAEAERSAEDVLLPAREYKTLRGDHVVVEPWGLRKGKRMLTRLEVLFDEARKRGEDTQVAELFESAYEECYAIVRDTIEWSDEQMEERLAMEDLLGLMELIWNVCIHRPDGGGVGGKLLALVGTAARTIAAQRGMASGATGGATSPSSSTSSRRRGTR